MNDRLRFFKFYVYVCKHTHMYIIMNVFHVSFCLYLRLKMLGMYLYPHYPKCGPGTSHISITLELVGNAQSLVPPQTH